MIADLFELNPLVNRLENDGVVIINSQSEWELKTFVCEGEYEKGITRILETYLRNFETSRQQAVWVSGFFGSGKSHLVKMLGYLWSNESFPSGSTARSIARLPTGVTDALHELSQKQQIISSLVVTGTLGDEGIVEGGDVRFAVLKLFLKKLGLPEALHQFRFLWWARKEGILTSIQSFLESMGTSLEIEVRNLYVSPALAKAVLNAMPSFAQNETNVLDAIGRQFHPVSTITREEFADEIKNKILPFAGFDTLPATLIILDEVQQSMQAYNIHAVSIQNLAQDISSQFKSRFILVCTGQNALNETEQLSPMLDRFTVPVQLSDTDVDTVTRKTVLRKKPSKQVEIEQKLERASGEIDRLLDGTDLAGSDEDKDYRVADYPLLPATRKFWHRILLAINVAGTNAKLRGQLRLVDKAVKAVAERPVGDLVPADFIFKDLFPVLQSLGILTNEVNNNIQQKLTSGSEQEVLKGRVLVAVFLIEQVKRVHLVRPVLSTPERIADLLISSLNEPSDGFRRNVKTAVDELLQAGLLMPLGNEVSLQTREGQEWQREFELKRQEIQAKDDKVAELRRERLKGYIDKLIGNYAVLQGQSKERREFNLHTGKEKPRTDESTLQLWLKDGWTDEEKSLMEEIRSEKPDSPLAWIYVRRTQDDNLRNAIIKHIAAKDVLGRRGIPATQEGKDARKAIETHQQNADNDINVALSHLMDTSSVFMAGGNEVRQGDLKKNITEALDALALRQFSQFADKADFVGWDKALTAAQGGQPDALKKIAFNGEPTQHPLAILVLQLLGTGQKTGAEIRSYFRKPPCGASQDAIDTLIFLLKQGDYISSTEANLTRQSLGKATFKKEVHTLSVQQKLEFKGWLNKNGITCGSNDPLNPKANTLLSQIEVIAKQAYGDAPQPVVPDLTAINLLKQKDGNEQIMDMLLQKEALSKMLAQFKADSALTAERKPHWNSLQKLNSLSESFLSAELLSEIKAIEQDRLLHVQPDPVQPLLGKVASHLNNLLQNKKALHHKAYQLEMATLQEHGAMAKLTPEQKHAILKQANLLPAPDGKVKVLDAIALVAELDNRKISAWDAERDALPARFQKALNLAIQEAEPKAVFMSLPRKTITNEAELDTYLQGLKKEILEKLKDAPSVNLQ